MRKVRPDVRLLVVVPLALVLCACGGRDTGPDAGLDDAGLRDSDGTAVDGGGDDVATDGADLDPADGGDPGAGDGGDAVYDGGDRGITDGGDPDPGMGSWIGEACADVADCDYTEAACLVEDYPGGMCTLACDRLCPDTDEPGHAVTFCIADPDDPSSGMCVARCDFDLYPDGGCREGYACVWAERHEEPGTSRQVCLPAGEEFSCTDQDVPQPNTGLEEPPGAGGCPAGMVPIGQTTTCIDAWEAHLVEVLDDGGTRPWSPYFNPDGARVRAVSAPGAVPQGYISGTQAAAACAEAGKRLCSRSEWETACRGPDDWTYPYGPDRRPGVCNDARSPHPAVEYFGTSDDWIWSQLGHPCINQLPDSLAETGAHPGCVSVDGAYDLMGNLHEWIDDPGGTFKGGYYVDTVINGDGCLYTTTAHNVSHWDYSTGFRCCADR